jgi:acyl-CoA thioester hydrolase
MSDRVPFVLGSALFSRDIAIRWRDLDAYDHVNNSEFLSLLEEARIQWFNSLPGAWRDARAEPVLARVEMNYRRSIRYPATVRVELGVLKIGRSSLGLGHQLSDAQTGTVYADGSSVLVWVSPGDGRPVELPSTVRGALPG